jgi:hypothetical protein
MAVYYKPAESKHCSKKADVIREELMEMLVYCNRNAESDNNKVSVESITPTEMEEYMNYLSERFSLPKEDINAYIEVVESTVPILKVTHHPIMDHQ